VFAQVLEDMYNVKSEDEMMLFAGAGEAAVVAHIPELALEQEVRNQGLDFSSIIGIRSSSSSSSSSSDEGINPVDCIICCINNNNMRLPWSPTFLHSLLTSR